MGGLAGDSQGIRWGFAGDSQAIWGIRGKNAGFRNEFQGDSFETTKPLYNIKVVKGNGNRVSLGFALTRTGFLLEIYEAPLF